MPYESYKPTRMPIIVNLALIAESLENHKSTIMNTALEFLLLVFFQYAVYCINILSDGSA